MRVLKEELKEAFGVDGIDPCRKILDPNWLRRAICRAQVKIIKGKHLMEGKRELLGVVLDDQRTPLSQATKYHDDIVY